MTELSLNCGAATDTGLVREHNEDRYWMDPARGAFLVVDGVGGQAAGERAAEIAVAAIREAIGEAAVLTDESVCPTFVRQGLRFCGAGACACQPISFHLLLPEARV